MENTLLRKLQFKAAAKPLLFRAPENLLDALDAQSLPWTTQAGASHDFVLGFFQTRAEVEQHAASLLQAAAEDARVWLAYPKKSSSLYRDLHRDEGWASLAESRWLPVSQVALDADWSALRWKPRDAIAQVTRKFDLR
jgi:hypothetical protein